MNKTFLFVVFVVTLSCGGEDGGLKEVNLKVNDESKEWLTSDSLGTNFIMRDDYGISQSFCMTGYSNGFSPSTTSYFWIKTKTTNTESYYQTYTSGFGNFFSIMITAGPEPFGDDITITLDDYSFTYNFKYQTISRLSTPYGYKSKTYTSEGFEENEKIYSTVNYVDTITIAGNLYNGVLHFKLADITEKWESYTITDIYIAKHLGLVKYIMDNKIVWCLSNQVN